MTFGIEKCETMVIKLVNFQSPPNYNDPTFYLGMNSIMNSILKVFSYIYLGIPFFRWSFIRTHYISYTF